MTFHNRYGITLAAVDFLSVQGNVDPEKIDISGICGWGGMALDTAALDTRVKATVASTMYDMSRVNTRGYFDAENSQETSYEKRNAMNAQRTADYKNGGYELCGGKGAIPFDKLKDFFRANLH